MFYTFTKWQFKARFSSLVKKHTFYHEGLIQQGINLFPNRIIFIIWFLPSQI